MKICVVLFGILCFCGCAHNQSLYKYKFTCPGPLKRVIVLDVSEEEIQNPTLLLYDRVLERCNRLK
jgi:hypothetical protein